MLKRVFYLIAIPLIALVLLKLLSFTNVISSSDPQNTNPIPRYGVHALPIPEDLSFAGEVVPLQNFDVVERLDRELLVNSYWQSQTLLFFKRANRWFEVIEPILKEEKIPDDFKYLSLVESGLMNVSSPAGASGFWQILQSTGRELGLEINSDIDERYHLERATRAAAKFLREAHAYYGNWTSAAAAYNMGRAGLNRQISDQISLSYYDLMLNEETARYVFRILAMKAIFENPTHYGFHLEGKDLYPPLEYYTVKVDTTINDLVAFSHHHQITYKELRTLNPWLRSKTLPNRSGKLYEIKITKESLFGYEPPVITKEPSMMEEVSSPGKETDL